MKRRCKQTEMSSFNAGGSRYRGDTDGERSTSEQLVDLHVYIVPPNIWRDKYNNLLNQSVGETISVGIIRVHPESKIYILRDEIEQQVGIDLIPRDYVFLKSVGRSLTRLKPKQEYQVKVKYFLPPHAYASELYLLEITPDIRAALVASSSESSTRPQTRTSINQPDDSLRNSYTYRDNRERVEDLHQGKNRRPVSPPLTRRHYSPLPPIIQTSPTPRQKTPPRSTARSSPSSPTPPDRHRQKLPSGSAAVPPVSQPPGNVSNNQHLPHTSQNGPVFNHNESDNDNNNRNWKQYEQNSLSQNLPLSQNPPDTQMSQNHQRSQNVYGNSSSPSQKQNGFHEKSPQPVHMEFPQDHMSPSHPDPVINSRHYPERVPPDQTNEDCDPQLSSSPTHSAEKVRPSQRDKQGPGPKGLYDPYATYTTTTTTNEDSGIAELTPDEHYREHYADVLDRRKQEENKRKRESDLQRQFDQDHARKEQEATERHQRRIEEHERANLEQRQKDEEEKHKHEDRKHDQDNEEGEKHRNIRKSGSQTDDELTRFPSPSQLRIESAGKEDIKSSNAIRANKEKLLLELEVAKVNRKKIEREREELIKRIKRLQNKTHNRRNHARDIWKKKYFEEKKITNPLEDQSSRLRHELEIIHRKLISTLEGPRGKSTKLTDLKPSRKVGDLENDELSGYNSGTSAELHDYDQILFPAMPSPSRRPVFGQPYPTHKLFWYQVSSGGPIGNINDPLLQTKKSQFYQNPQTGRVQSLPPRPNQGNQLYPLPSISPKPNSQPQHILSPTGSPRRGAVPKSVQFDKVYYYHHH